KYITKLRSIKVKILTITDDIEWIEGESVISKEDRRFVELLNKRLGTNHRSRPYDFKKKDDLVEAATMATAEFLDYNKYQTIIWGLHGELDETIETFNPSAWGKIGLMGNTSVESLDNALYSIQLARKAFGHLYEESLRAYQSIWRIIFSSGNDDVLRHFI